MFILPYFEGRAVIAAYRKTERFVAMERRLTDEFLVCQWAMLAATRFLGLVLDVLSIVVVASAALFTVYARDNDTRVFPIGASIVLIYSMQVNCSYL